MSLCQEDDLQKINSKRKEENRVRSHHITQLWTNGHHALLDVADENVCDNNLKPPTTM